jgi:phosphoribosylformylglycinamidine synthase
MNTAQPSDRIEKALQLGFTQKEWSILIKLLRREPSDLELDIFAHLWQDEFSQKHAFQFLRELPRHGKHTLTNVPYSNTEFIDIGSGLAIILQHDDIQIQLKKTDHKSIKSGIVRAFKEIVCTGGRPILIINSFYSAFANEQKGQVKIEQELDILAQYLRTLKISAGLIKTSFDDEFKKFSYLDSMVIGLVRHERIKFPIAKGPGNKIYLVYPPDLETKQVPGEATNSKSANVEMKMLLAILELSKKRYVQGICNINADGMIGSIARLALNGQSGIWLNLENMPEHVKTLPVTDLLLKADLGEMLVVIRRGFEDEIKAACTHFGLACAQIAEIIPDEIIKISNGKERLSILPTGAFLQGASARVLEHRYHEPTHIRRTVNLMQNRISEPKNYTEILLQLLSSPNISDRSNFNAIPVEGKQQGSPINFPYNRAAYYEIKDTDKAILAQTAGRSLYTYLDPYKGAAVAVAEAARKIVCLGGTPIGVTIGMHFGNPEEPENFYMFKRAVEGIRDASNALNTPVASIKVNYASEPKNKVHYPLVSTALAGLIPKSRELMTPGFKQNGDFIMMLGTIKGELGASEYLKLAHQKKNGIPPNIDLIFEKRVQRACLEGIQKDIIKSAIEVTSGGIAIAVVKACLASSVENIGASIYISRKLREDEILFSESQSIILITIDEHKLLEIEKIASNNIVPCVTIGRVKMDGRVRFNEVIDISLDEARGAYQSAR